jgi:Bacterial Ig-like domain
MFSAKASDSDSESGAPIVTAGSSAGKITFQAHVVDAASGVNDVEVGLDPAFSPAGRVPYSVPLKLAAGTAHDGIWQAVAKIPAYSPPGYWLIDDVLVSDASGGGLDSRPVASNWPRSWPDHFIVESDYDVKRPALTSLHLSTSKVNTTSGAKAITVTVKATDDLSGVAEVDVGATPPTSSRYHDIGVTLRRTSGTARKGTYSGRLLVPAWTQPGKHDWALEAEVTDVAGNETILEQDDLFKRGLPSQVTVTSPKDATKPVLKSLAFPAAVNALAKSQKVTFSVKATDTKSGVASVNISFRSRSEDFVDGKAKLVTGKITSGTWRGTLTIPRCSEPGNWSIDSVDVVDRVGNTTTLDAKQLKAMHLPTSILVDALDAVGPAVHGPQTTSRTAAVKLSFTEPTLWKNPAAATIAVTNLNGGSPIAGAWTCKNTAGSVVTCDADGADVLTASWKPSSPLTSGETLSFRSSAPASDPVGIYDTSGNPMSTLLASVRVT